MTPSLRYRMVLPLVLRLARRAKPTVESARRFSANPTPKGTVVTAATLSGLPVETYVPVEGVRQQGRLLFVHGGAFVSGSAANGRRWPALIGRRLGIEVISVDYRLAPENPFPAAIEDVAAVYSALRSDNGPLLVCGESAGGNAILGGLQLAQAAGAPDGVVLLWPSTDGTRSGGSAITNEGRDILSGAGMRWATEMYLQGHDPLDPLVSPVLADLGWLPRTLIQVGDRDMLLDDSRRLAAHLEEQGVDVSLSVWRHMIHGFAGVGPVFPEAAQAIDEVVRWMDRQLSWPNARQPSASRPRDHGHPCLTPHASCREGV